MKKRGRKYPVCSGRDVVKVLGKFGYEVVGQKGSHVKLRKILATGKHTIVVPLHDELDIGTLRSIVRRVSKIIPEEQFLQMLWEEV